MVLRYPSQRACSCPPARNANPDYRQPQVPYRYGIRIHNTMGVLAMLGARRSEPEFADPADGVVDDPFEEVVEIDFLTKSVELGSTKLNG